MLRVVSSVQAMVPKLLPLARPRGVEALSESRPRLNLVRDPRHHLLVETVPPGAADTTRWRWLRQELLTDSNAGLASA